MPVEKPMALNAVQGREMLDASRRAGKRLMINFSSASPPITGAPRRK